MRKGLLCSSLIALLVVFNGSVLLKVNPLGDFLTLMAATLWAFYCIILRRLGRAYSTAFITRKVFFYGILSRIPYFTLFSSATRPDLLRMPTVHLNLIFLSVVASLLGYLMWNAAVKALGATKCANYLYIVPLITLGTSSIVLSETITVASEIGAVVIICGVT